MYRFGTIIVHSRLVFCRFSPEVAAKRGLSPTEMAAVEAIHRAVEFNPHVPKVLLRWICLNQLACFYACRKKLVMPFQVLMR